MNAYNPLESMKRLEAAGLERRQAEAIAGEINDGTSSLVTRDYLDERLESELSKQTIRMGGLTAGIVAVATAILGVLISLK
jgi:hypothetical protein